MSKYTTELRYICEMKSGFPVETMPEHTPDEIIESARGKIFDFSYPIYDPNHKPELETKIIKHYYTREIGAETFGLWHLWLNEKMNLIMPKYNDLYKIYAEDITTALENINVYTTTDKDSNYTRTDNLKDTLSGTDSATNTQNQSTSETGHVGTVRGTDSETKDKFSDTPQGTVTNVDNNTYLTEYRNITNDTDETITENSTKSGTATTTGTTNRTTNTTTNKTGTQENIGNENILMHEHGYRGAKTYAELMRDYVENVINIDQMIVNELSDLFILLW